MPTEQAIQALLEQQRAHFFSGRTLPVQARIQALGRLEQAILDHEEDLYRALQADLGKSRMEAFLCEISLTLSELRYVRRHVKGWSRRRPVLPSLAQFPGRCSVLPEPYGVTLILSPWNYPVLLTLEPLIGALAAGNCAVVKPSAYSPHTSAVLAALIGEAGSAYVLGVCRLAARVPGHALYFDNPYLLMWLAFLLCVLLYCRLTPRGQRKYAMAAALSALTLLVTALLPIRERLSCAVSIATGPTRRECSPPPTVQRSQALLRPRSPNLLPPQDQPRPQHPTKRAISR